MQIATAVAATNARTPVRIAWPTTAPWRLLAAACAPVVTWHMRRATRILLSALDDRALDDIGLQRSDIDRIVRNVTWPRRGSRP